MTIMVRNDENNIEFTYENVKNVLQDAEKFVLCMEDGKTATFHFVDEEDGSEWECFRLH